MSERYDVKAKIETSFRTGSAQYFGLTAREVEATRRAIREMAPAGSTIDVKVTAVER